MYIRKYLIVVFAVVIVGAIGLDIVLLRQIGDLEAEYEFRGAYTFPGFGAFFLSENPDGSPERAPLTLVIFFSAQTTCPSSLSEVESYRRLLPVFSERGQRIVAVTTREDYPVVSAFLKHEELDISLNVFGSENPQDGMTLRQMGISPHFCPFKILYDSTLTAIFMRGANNTPESQAEFEATVLWLSEKVSE
ncbi:hypothetical protein ES703_57000 [subsurface metagenome]